MRSLPFRLPRPTASPPAAELYPSGTSRAAVRRNIGRGPNYFVLDSRPSRRFALERGERRSLELIAEGFNLLNRTNFKSVNNTVGDIALEDLPRPLVGRRALPTLPLSFTAAFDPRQFQIGLKINW